MARGKAATNSWLKARHALAAADDDAVRREQACEWPGCDLDGEFRAPRSPRHLRDFRWFCLDHVRAYNAQWDYFASATPEDIEQARRADTVWHRPSWPFGARSRHAENGRGGRGPFGMRDIFGVTGNGDDDPAPIVPSGPRDHALAKLDLDREATPEQIKARYRTLVKIHHPDANGGSKESEERLKAINEAYTYLASGESR